MLRKVEKNAKSVDEALRQASEEFGVPVEELSYKVEREVGKGLMGLLLGREVIISAWITKEAEAEEAKKAELEKKRTANEAKEQARAKVKEKAKAKAAAAAAPKVNRKPMENKKAEYKPADNNPADGNSTDGNPVDVNPADVNPYAPKGGSDASAVQEKGDAPKKNREVTEKSLVDAKYFLDELLLKMGFDDAQVDVQNGGDAINVDVSGSRMGLLIGKRGDTLDSVQYLTSLYVNKAKNSYIKVNIDTEGYRGKREETLVKLAHGLERRVLREKKPVTLEPMSPNERRIIHAALQNNDKIRTYSVGEEPNRKIVVALNNTKQQ